MRLHITDAASIEHTGFGVSFTSDAYDGLTEHVRITGHADDFLALAAHLIAAARTATPAVTA